MRDTSEGNHVEARVESCSPGVQPHVQPGWQILSTHRLLLSKPRQFDSTCLQQFWQDSACFTNAAEVCTWGPSPVAVRADGTANLGAQYHQR